MRNNKFDIDDLTNVTIKIISTHVTEFTCRTESALLFFGGVLYVYGGQSFGKYAFDDAFIISVNPYDEMESYKFFDIPLYSFAYAQFSDYFILYSGLEIAYFPQIKPSNGMIIEYAMKLNDSICGNGFVYNKTLNRDSQCPLGTYSGINDTECKDCEKGFFSNFPAATDITQCLPCPEGTFSNITGLAECF